MLEHLPRPKPPTYVEADGHDRIIPELARSGRKKSTPESIRNSYIVPREHIEEARRETEILKMSIGILQERVDWLEEWMHLAEGKID